MANLLAPKVDLAALVIRLGLAAIFIVHGYFKVPRSTFASLSTGMSESALFQSARKAS